MAILLVGCDGKTTRRNHSEMVTDIIEQSAPIATWHSCLAQGAQAEVILGEQTLRVTCSFWAIKDSISIISITPMFGIEMYRLEATPEQITIIDKMQHQYIVTHYDDINRYLTPPMRYQDIEDAISGASRLPGTEQTALAYSAMGHTAALIIHYPEIRMDVPVNTNMINTTRYQRLEIEQLISQL